MSSQSSAAAGRNFFQSALTLMMLSIFTLQAGCSRSPQTSPWTMEKTRLLASRIVHRDVEPARVVDDSLERFGRVQVRLSEEDAPRTLSFMLRQELTRGDGVTVIQIVDEQTGSRSVYQMHDETGEAIIATEAGTQRMTFNADGTVRVGNALAHNERQAAELLHKTGVMAPVSEYSLTVLLDTLYQYLPESETGRGGAAAAVVVVVWLAGSFFICSSEYTRKGCNTNNGMSTYCRDYCRQVGCACWK